MTHADNEKVFTRQKTWAREIILCVRTFLRQYRHCKTSTRRILRNCANPNLNRAASLSSSLYYCHVLFSSRHGRMYSKQAAECCVQKLCTDEGHSRALNEKTQGRISSHVTITVPTVERSWYKTNWPYYNNNDDDEL